MKGGKYIMKNNNVNWMFLIAVALVVAVVASVISAGITGNVIKVKQDKGGKFDVYTKAEIDNMFKQLGPAAYWDNLTNADYYNLKDSGNIYFRAVTTLPNSIVSLFNRCSVIKDYQSSGVISCDNICKNNGNMTCVDANYEGTLRSCSDYTGSINTARFCKCC
jgi:hypothetical protein